MAQDGSQVGISDHMTRCDQTTMSEEFWALQPSFKTGHGFVLWAGPLRFGCDRRHPWSILALRGRGPRISQRNITGDFKTLEGERRAARAARREKNESAAAVFFLSFSAART